MKTPNGKSKLTSFVGDSTQKVLTQWTLQFKDLFLLLLLETTLQLESGIIKQECVSLHENTLS